MKARLAALKRLKSLYGEIEEMDSLGLQRTAAAVREVDHAIAGEQEAMRSSNAEARDALAVGDHLEWMAARKRCEVAARKQQGLLQLRQERETLKEEASTRYIASRTRSEQMKHMVDGAEAQAETEMGRRAQAALDDRFLARRRWSDAREEQRDATDINLP
jgi:hypothetical protein